MAENRRRSFLALAGFAGVLMLAATGVSWADAVPSGWTCVGTCGSLGANGVVTLSPTGNSSYQYVSTSNAASGVGALPTGGLGSETNGSTLATTVFSAAAGTPLNFYFNYVTSDGAGFADYAWAELFTSGGSPFALLFTARTETSGSIVPGMGLPSPTATLTPSSVPIIPGGPNWSALDGSSGACYLGVGNGCGYTGWVLSNYTIPTTGNYYLEVGVVNWSDENFDSGLALDGVTVGGVPITPAGPTPEPSSIILLGSAVTGLLAAARRRRFAH